MIGENAGTESFATGTRSARQGDATNHVLQTKQRTARHSLDGRVCFLPTDSPFTDRLLFGDDCGHVENHVHLKLHDKPTN